MNDISVTIPPGAIPADKTARIELGVALYGPFAFPENYEPVSPIIWLCVQDAELQQPLAITLPHLIVDIDKVELTLAKANHDNSTKEQDVYQFNPSDCISKKFTNPTDNCNGSGIFTVKHCCLYCTIAKISPDLARLKGYCLHTLIKSESPAKLRIIHVCTYFMTECFMVS